MRKSTRERKKLTKQLQEADAQRAEAIKTMPYPKERVEHILDNRGENRTIVHSVTLRPQKIYIAVPTDELMFSKFLGCYQNLNIMPWDSIGQTENTYLPEARNDMWNVFLDEPLAGNWMLMLDSDVLVKPTLIEELMAHNKPIVGGWYKKKKINLVKDANGQLYNSPPPVVYKRANWDEEHNRYNYQPIQRGEGLQKVDGMGAGCWLITREAAEKIGRSPFGNDVGEDLIFCTAAWKAGIDMWVDWSIECPHVGVFHV